VIYSFDPAKNPHPILEVITALYTSPFDTVITTKTGPGETPIAFTKDYHKPQQLQYRGYGLLIFMFSPSKI
jgi:hypothetical protein